MHERNQVVVMLVATRYGQLLLFRDERGDALAGLGYLVVELFHLRSMRRERFDVGVERIQARHHLVTLGRQIAKFLVFTLEALGFFECDCQPRAQFVLFGFEAHKRANGACRTRCVTGQQLIDLRERMSRGRPRARTCRKQLRRHVGRVAQ